MTEAHMNAVWYTVGSVLGIVVILIIILIFIQLGVWILSNKEEKRG